MRMKGLVLASVLAASTMAMADLLLWQVGAKDIAYDYAQIFYNTSASYDGDTVKVLENKVGDFDGKTSVKDRELVINWNDGGKKDTVTFSYTCERKDGKVVTRTDVQLNHKDTTLPVTFVR